VNKMREIREFENYAEMNAEHQKEVNEFPFIWVFAFSESDFIKKMTEEIVKRKPQFAEITTMEEIAKHVTSIGAGGYVFKEDVQRMNEMFEHHKVEREHFEEKEENLVERILSEMCNHEFGYTQDPDDTLMALGRTYEDFDNDERFARAWSKAAKKCIEDFDLWNN